MKRVWIISAIIIGCLACSIDKDDSENPSPGNQDPVPSAPATFKVVEYVPAPGQFINEGVNLATRDEATEHAEALLKKKGLISLGAFGGYMTVRFASPVTNRDGNDFAIRGNPFDGNSEPGIVWVSADINSDGIANDPWYELKGGDESETTRNYSVTYHRPEVPGAIRWTDSEGNEGTVLYLPEFHKQMYYPAWITEDSYTLSGTRLKDRMRQDADGIWHNDAFTWGYADNAGSDLKDYYNYFDISNAINAEGKSVTLKQIDFVKIQCAVQKCNELTGEVSTEIADIKTL